MTITVEMVGHQYKNFKWCHVVGDPPVVVTAPRSGLISIKQKNMEIVVYERELRRALAAIREEGKII